MDLHTAMPGEIISYNRQTQKVKVKPLLKRLLLDQDGGEIVEPLPVINDVPLAVLRGGGFFITFPVKPGDKCTLLFSERSLDFYMEGDGSDTNPVDFRSHHLADAVCLPCSLYPTSLALAVADSDGDDLVLGNEGGVKLHIKSDGTMHLGSKQAADALALASKVEAELNTVKSVIAGAAVAAGDGGATFKTNIGIGFGNAGYPKPVGSGVVKAD
jgi:hypothetical protein